MKKTIAYLCVCLSLFTFSGKLAAQKSGKYYAFSSDEKRIRKVKVTYNDGVLVMKSGRVSIKLYKDNTKTYKAYKGTMFYVEGSSAARAFLLEDGSLLVTRYNYSQASDDCQVKYNEKKDKSISYLAMDKAKASAMNKDKAIKLFEQYFSKVCEAYQVYQDAELAGVELPAEGMKNTKLLVEATKVIQSYITRRSNTYTVVRSYFYSKEWNEIRHKYSDRVMARRVRVIGVIKGKGECYFVHYYIRQNLKGTKYGPMFCEGNSRSTQVSCKKAAAKR